MAKRKQRDPYETLGVAKTASPSEIQMAFRARAREVHPDVAGEEATADFRCGWERWRRRRLASRWWSPWDAALTLAQAYRFPVAGSGPGFRIRYPMGNGFTGIHFLPGEEV